MASTRSASSVRRSSPRAAPKASSASRRGVNGDELAAYARRGAECAFANVRMVGRVISALYDDALRPAELRASQLALLWAILASEPVDISRLTRLTHTDQTTLSRTIDKLRAARLVSVAPGEDRRVRVIKLTALGRRRFLRAIPHWETAQREVSEWISLADLRALGRAARRQAKGIPAASLSATRAAQSKADSV